MYFGWQIANTIYAQKTVELGKKYYTREEEKDWSVCVFLGKNTLLEFSRPMCCVPLKLCKNKIFRQHYLSFIVSWRHMNCSISRINLLINLEGENECWMNTSLSKASIFILLSVMHNWFQLIFVSFVFLCGFLFYIYSYV